MGDENVNLRGSHSHRRVRWWDTVALLPLYLRKTY